MKLKLICFILLFIHSPALAAEKPKNIIFLLGDGMGVSYLTAYRDFKDDPNTKILEPTLFDQYLKGLVSTKTYHFSDKGQRLRPAITDSAAGATAYSCGIKAKLKTVGLSPNGQPCETMFEFAKKHGKKTGVAVSSSIVHATPSAFITGHKDRNAYMEIMRQYVEEKINNQPKFDVLLGGGQDYLEGANKDLIPKLHNLGYQVVVDAKDFEKLNQEKVVGVFSPDGLPSALGAPPAPPRLDALTAKAISLLNKNNPNGFFLLVEGSQIDWAGHTNDITKIIYEMEEFEKSLQIAIDFANKDKNTLVIVVADHESGGLSLGNGEYEYDLSFVKEMPIAFDLMLQNFSNTKEKNIDAYIKKHVPWDKFSKHHQESILKEAKIFMNADPKDSQWKRSKGLIKAIASAVDERVHITWGTGNHSASDVPLISYGKGSEHFHGYMQNTEVGLKIRSLIQ